MTNLFIYLAIIISGASVLALEILGTRILAPFYGASLYLWSALISVTLAALSVGYVIGGRWADRGPTLPRFCSVIGLAGLWVVMIPWLRTPALAITESLGLRAAVLITATVLFFPPLALLGVVSPYAIRLKAASLKVVGTTAGDLYAVSTVASVVAAVVTGFFLIPNVGVYRLLFLIGLLLIATAGFGFAVGRGPKAAAIAPVLLAAAGVLAFQAAPAATADPDHGLLAVEQSAYGEIRVVDYEGLRYMLLDGGSHTVVDPETWISYFTYVDVIDITRRCFAEPGALLLVGLGGGSIAKSFYHDGWSVDAVEIDPVVAEVARNHFGLKPREANIIIMDGRQYLMSRDNTYDIIVLDAFGSSSIPFHLVTAEAFELVKAHLNPQGMLAMNLEGVGWNDPVVRSIAATAMKAFKHVQVLPIEEPPTELGNLVVFASDRPIELREELPQPLYRLSPEYHRVHAWDNRFAVDPTGVPVLTDDLNPIDVWAERVNLEARRQLHDYFDESAPTW